MNEFLYFADIAGFHDTSGDLIEFINCFVNKKIFLRANHVKFLFPVTHSQITTNRGVEVREQLQTLQNICNVKLNELAKSILPIVTKCSTSDDDIDLDVIKSNMYEMFENEFQQQEQETKLVRRESIIEHLELTNTMAKNPSLGRKKSSINDEFTTP